MRPDQSTADWSEHLQFFGRFVRSPFTVGAFAPSSRQLASAMVAPIADAALLAAHERQARARPLTIVELGPGTGAFTRAIVRRLERTDRFLSVELDPVFAEALARRWPNIECVCASAESLAALVGERGLGPIDHIVSGLPFATLPMQMSRRISEAIGQTLRPGGTFTTFSYVQSYRVPAAAAFRRQMNRLMGSTPSIRFVAWNFPPALAMTWTNGESEARREA